MKHNKLMLVFALVLIVSMVLSACQPQTIIQTVEVEKVVEKTVEIQVEVEKEKVVESTKIVEVEKKAFTTPDPILGDLKVRQGLYYCTNKVDLVKAGYPLLDEAVAATLPMDTMIPTSHWAYAGEGVVQQYPYDPAKGAALFEEAGWTLPEGAAVRTNAEGEVLALKFATTTAAFRVAWAAVWEAQMAECGVQILRSHVPASWWFGDTTGLAVRDFQLGAYAWVGEIDPGGLTLWACDQIPLPENNWQGQNYMGWCNEAANTAIKAANNTLVKEERIAQYKIVQEEYAKDVPAIPLFNRAEFYSVNAKMEGFNPQPGDADYMYNIAEWEVPGKDTIVVGFTQPIASLHTLVESAFVAVLAASLTGTYHIGVNTLNYDYQPATLKELPQMTNDDVEVKAGDKVYDVNGEVVELANGVKVKDATGADVEFSGSPIMMKQMTLTVTFRDELKWQDGSPVGKADFELGYKTACDKESGATSFINCDRTASIEFNDHGYVQKLAPGVQDPTFNQPYFGMAPANQPIESDGPYKGMTLKDVPAKDWPTLPEVAETPWSYGPYMITEYDGQTAIKYEANPYYWGGTPKTKNIIIQIITPENIEAQLITGQIDVIGAESGLGITETLQKAEADGTIKNLTVASATWEHIDINLFLK
jgi:ABC-type transport system substrate-binding protein